MGTYRIYTGDDGKTTWEEIDLDAMPDWTKGIDATQIRFGSRAPGVMQDWHPAPQRQFVISLSGQLQIGFEDGSTKVFGPGDARLVEDTTGWATPPSPWATSRASPPPSDFGTRANLAITRPEPP